MEVTLENINNLSEKLKQKDLEKSLKKVQDYSKIAQQLIEQNPELTADELGELYEKQMEENTKQSQENDGQEIDG